MKIILSILFSIILIIPCRSQGYELERLLLDIEKLSQLKNILTDLYKGYEILSEGYTTIKNISEGNFNLHEAFLDGLLQVSPVVKNYKRVFDIIDDQAKMVSEYKSNFSRFQRDKNFSVDEIGYMASVYNNLITESLDDLQNLLNILTAGQMRMSDDQRIHGIDKIYDHVKDKLNFLRNFNSSALVLTMQRSADNNDAQSIQKLYGF